MKIKIGKSCEMCNACGGHQGKTNIIAEFSRKEMALCENCCKKLKEELSK